MKFLKRIILVLLSIIVIGFVFRGWLFRHLVTYHLIDHRKTFEISNDKLNDFIKTSTDNRSLVKIEDIVTLGLKMTAKHLQFTTHNNEADPNKLIDTQNANCIGYAAFFSTITNDMLVKYQPDGVWSASPEIGELHFLGFNIHNLFSSPFFKDHDFVVLENKKTGETIAVDPSLYDYLHIKYVNYTR